MIERQTAKKVRIVSVTEGEWVKKEGMEPSFVQTQTGERVARARIMGTVVAKFVAEDGGFASVTLDDGSDTLRLKTFKTAKPLDTVEIGTLIDAIGKIREWNGEIYMIPEVVHPVENPTMELLRRLEVSTSGGTQQTPEQQENVREALLAIIDKHADGISYDALIQEAGKNEQDVEKVVNDLLAEGVCYEPTPGKIKKI